MELFSVVREQHHSLFQDAVKEIDGNKYIKYIKERKRFTFTSEIRKVK